MPSLSVFTRLSHGVVVNCKASLSLATDVYLKPGSYVPMTLGKMDRAFISMFSKYTVCVDVLIVKARAMYMLAGYDKYAGFSWLVVCHEGRDSVIKQFFRVSVYWIDLQSWIRY